MQTLDILGARGHDQLDTLLISSISVLGYMAIAGLPEL